jgi:hypothetical protein
VDRGRHLFPGARRWRDLRRSSSDRARILIPALQPRARLAHPLET